MTAHAVIFIPRDEPTTSITLLFCRPECRSSYERRYSGGYGTHDHQLDRKEPYVCSFCGRVEHD